jgi:hypothetical protein
MRRKDALGAALAQVEATVAALPAGLTETCHDLLDQLHGQQGDFEVPMDTYSRLFDAARELMTVLLDRGHAEEAVQQELRAAIAGIALPNKEELAKLAKYRSMLETSLQRRLAALDQIRKLNAGRVASESGAEKAKEYRVRLRVVA